MMDSTSLRPFGAALLAILASSSPGMAGQDANFVLYNQHMEEKGETEVEVYSDYSHVGKGEANYTAQLYEIEYGVTDLFTTSIYLETAKTFEDDQHYDFGSFRWENRYRLFQNETLLNPVLYAEYEYKKPTSRFMRSVVGRTDGEEEEHGEEASEHELETKLILGHDITSNLNVAFNTIQEINFMNGLWSFGYVGGLNYAFYRAYDQSGVVDLEEAGIQKLTLGLEVYGGLGDSEKGLTLSGSKTEQYMGVNLRADLKNEMHVGIGGAFGLTDESEDALVRLTAGYEFE
jgi:hypothetical protein